MQKKSESTTIYGRFIEALELLYIIVLSAGIYYIIQETQSLFFNDAKDLYTGFNNFYHSANGELWQIAICSLVLVRFFFAPQKNIQGLPPNSLTMVLDVWFMLASHAVLFYIMCSNISQPNIFYGAFFALLVLNSVWLIVVYIRKREPKLWRWAFNNASIALLMFITYKLLVAWKDNAYIGLAFINCFIDLLTNARFYMLESKKP